MFAANRERQLSGAGQGYYIDIPRINGMDLEPEELEYEFGIRATKGCSNHQIKLFTLGGWLNQIIDTEYTQQTDPQTHIFMGNAVEEYKGVWHLQMKY